MRPRVASLLVVAALGVAGVRSLDAATPYPPATLSVASIGSNFTIDSQELDVWLDLTGERAALGRAVVLVPPHYPLIPIRDAGAPVGVANVWTRARDGQLDLYTGPIGAVVVDSTADGCGSTGYDQIWEMRLRQGTRALDLPLYVFAPHRSAGRVELALCPPANGPRIVAVGLQITGPGPPRTPGAYLWRALVTPRATGRRYELRAVVPVPHILTLHSTLDTERHEARLSGTLRVDGHAEARRTVILTSLDRSITPHGPIFRDAPIASATTDDAGRYSFRLPLPFTRGFVADAPSTAAPCGHVVSSAPGGCVSVTRAGAESIPMTVSVP